MNITEMACPQSRVHYVRKRKTVVQRRILWKRCCDDADLVPGHVGICYRVSVPGQFLEPIPRAMSVYVAGIAGT